MSDLAVRDLFPQLAEQAVSFADLVAFFTEQVLTGESAEQVIEAVGNLRRALDGADLSIGQLLPCWQGEPPPADFPPASSILEWVYRRGRCALAALLAAAGGTLDDFSSLAPGWNYAQAFAREHVRPVNVARLHALLRGEASRARLSSVGLPPAFDGGIGQDWAEALNMIPIGWVDLSHDEPQGGGAEPRLGTSLSGCQRGAGTLHPSLSTGVRGSG